MLAAFWFAPDAFHLVAATTPASQPATSPAVKAVAIDHLIEQLGSDNADERDSAQQQLVDLGASAAPSLQKAADTSSDPEIRSRAAAALAQMKEQDSNAASIVTLHLKDTPLQEALDAIGKQAHAEIRSQLHFSQKSQPPTLTLDIDRKPFWDVMAEVCTIAHATPMLENHHNGVIRLLPAVRNWMSDSPHEVAGPFWINVTGLKHLQTVDTEGATERNDEFTLSMNVLPEPKLSVCRLSPVHLTQAIDDAGNSLILKTNPAASAGAPFLSHISTGPSHRIDCALSYPQHPGKTIVNLTGEITASLGQDTKDFCIDDVLGTPTVTNPITQCVIHGTVSRQGADLCQLTLQCTRNGASDDQWSALINTLDAISLEDADGKPLTGFQPTLSAGGSLETDFTATRLFSRSTFVAMTGGARQITKTGEAKKLIWSLPTKIKSVVVPVTFKDLPMP